MKITRLSLILPILLTFVLLLTGCKSTLLVHNATLEQVIPILKDYVGTHGYQITYENDQTGSFRLDMGKVYMPAVSETTKSKMTSVQPPLKDSNQPMTSYEDTTWRTVSVPGHYADASAIISIVQQGNDVVITVDGNDAAGTSLNDVRDYIASFGYTVDNR